MGIQEDIQAVEDEIRKTSYNKATSHHIGRLKAKLARLREEVVKKASTKSGGDGYSVKKSGDATVALVGFPSVGKSTLLNKITGANSEVGAYEFTTLDVIPGVLDYKDATIQVLDVPGLVRGAASGRGRGREVIAVVRNSNLVLFLLDVFQPGHYKVLIQELYDAGIRLNTSPPDVVIKRKDRGGVTISTTMELELTDDLIKAVLGEYKIHNAHVLIRDNINVDELIDVIMGNRVYVPSVIVVNKVDLANEEILNKMEELFPDATFISANEEKNLEAVKDLIYDSLDFIRVYLKPQGGLADMDEPLIVTDGVTVGDICERLHRDFRDKFRYSQVWGTSAKHPGQRAGLDHYLDDGDLLTLIIQK
ncbi:OBG GTPase family GTP-binding protein [Methanococcoides alaskense]|uniref:Small GTP-binding protein n=1 Tax=Methanococcoides alaskense TaxID=325778 RepID=A0AA90TZ39_9EURY|nr:GTP-binding protein [Methanococcoides alaskense]MDA0524882.1 GTP-binding protein [Methanococcoides alaskense]MDR6222204.1 small GTP-binding protein [Methanococcoides alaskense]